MNLMTPVFFALWGLLILVAVVVSLGRLLRWRRRVQEEREERERAYTAALDEAAQSVPESEIVAQSTEVNVEPQPAAEVAPATTPDTVPDATPEPVATAAPSWSAGTSASTQHTAAWAPPESATWQPPADQVYEASWRNVELFRERDEQFPEPDYIPKVTADQVPATDPSDYSFGSATPALAAMMPATDVERTASELTQAGYHQPHAFQNLQATRFLLVFVSLMMLGLLLVVVPASAEPWVLGSMLVVPVVLWASPRILIQNRAADRRSELERAMPDMLDMLNMCVSQGLTIPASLKRIAKDLMPVYPVLGGELTIVVEQAEIGNLRIALENFGRRVDVPEVDSFVNLMTQSDRMGTSASAALSEYATTMRESLRQRTDEKANSASFKLMFPTVLFMMPAVFMFLMGPAILELQNFFNDGGIDQIRQGTSAATDALNQNNFTQ